MKNIVVIVVALLLAALISACGVVIDESNDKIPVDVSTGGVNSSNNNKASGNELNSNNDTKKNAKITIDEKVIYNHDNITITTKGLDLTGFLGPEINVLIENNSTKNITVQTRETSVNGVMVDPFFSADVASGKKVNDSITLSSSDLDIANISVIKDIEFSFHIFNSDTWDDDVNSELIKLTTSADEAYIQQYDDSGITVYEENGLKVIVKKLNSSDSFWGSELHLFIENNSTNKVTIQARDVSVNGFMIDPFFSSEVGINKKAFDTMTFMESDMTDNDITDITDLEFKLHIFETDSWETIKDTDIINISF